jgi:hypothetical protein
MEPPLLDYRPAQTAAQASVVRVERTSGGRGGVVVRVAYPPAKRREEVIAAAGSCVGMAVCAGLFVWFGWRSSPFPRPFLLLAPLFPVAVLVLLLVRRLGTLADAYTFEADRDGLTIQRARGRRECSERLPREQITDVRIGFGSARARRSAAWLIIALTPPHRFNRRLLHGLGADQLARVANALRAGLGLPPRSWP